MAHGTRFRHCPTPNFNQRRHLTRAQILKSTGAGHRPSLRGQIDRCLNEPRCKSCAYPAGTEDVMTPALNPLLDG
eukprot:11195252-Lingulodinium_polyedra.AAC.1